MLLLSSADGGTGQGLSMRGLQRGWLQLSASAPNKQQCVKVLLERKVKMRAGRNEEPQSADTEVCHRRICPVKVSVSWKAEPERE